MPRHISAYKIGVFNGFIKIVAVSAISNDKINECGITAAMFQNQTAFS